MHCRCDHDRGRDPEAEAAALLLVVVELVAEALNRNGKAIRGSKVLVLGVAYKADIDDVRESPSLDIMEKLRERGAKIEYSDPHVASIRFAGSVLKHVPFTAAHLKRFDCAVIATAHKDVSYSNALKWSKAIVDTRNALRGVVFVSLAMDAQLTGLAGKVPAVNEQPPTVVEFSRIQ